MLGRLITFSTIEALSKNIVEHEARFIVIKSLTGDLSTHEVYIIKEGEKLTILVGDDRFGYSPVSELIDEKIAQAYGLLDVES